MYNNIKLTNIFFCLPSNFLTKRSPLSVVVILLAKKLSIEKLVLAHAA